MPPKRTRAKLPPVDGFLGIDLGTTSLRARLFLRSSGTTCAIRCISKSTGNGRFSEGEFSSTIYPVDGLDPVYNGNVACPDRIPLSAKVSFPPLAGEAPTSDLHRKGYELVQVHFDKLQDENIRERARHGIEALFHAVSRELDRQCSEMITATVNIRAIALSIPAHWTLDYEDEYRKIVQKAFSNFHGDIFFLTEAEALAHYLYRDHRAVLVPDPDDEHGNVVLIMDFGGHNMNGCLIDIAHGSDDDPGFYHVTPAQDAGGGSEQWEHNVVKKCIQKMIDRGCLESHHDATPEQKQLIFDDFNRFKKDHCEDIETDFKFHYLTPQGRLEPLILGSEELAVAHNEAFASAFEKANCMIEEASARSKKARVIVTGGSVNSKLTRDRLETYCQEHEVSSGLKFMNDWIDGLNMRIAHGGAYAIAYQLPLKRFIGRGAAFGLQVKEIGPRTRNPQETPWNSQARVLFSKGQSSPEDLKFATMGRSEFRVICDPFFKDNESDFLIYRKCYDLIDIGVLRRGIWSFGISIVESDKGMVFKLHGKREPMRGKQQDPNIPRNPVLNKTWEFPLYTDIGANAVHLGNPNETSNAIFSSLWEDVRPPKKKSTNSSRTDDQCHQKREGPHASPRETLVSPEMKYTTSANGPPNQPQARAGSSPTQTAIPGGKASIPSSREETASNETITVTPQYDIV